MLAEAPPIFVPSGDGFKAVYNLTFTTDLEHLIYLMGANQGSPIAAKTLRVDNGANGASCIIKLRGADIVVGPFAVSYIDCENALDLVIVGSTSSAIQLDVLTYKVAKTSVIKKTLITSVNAPVLFSGGGATPINSVPVKILSIGNGCLSYFNLTCTILNSAGLKYGYTSAASLGILAVVGVPLEIPYDDSKEFWLKSNGIYSDSYTYFAG